MNNITKIRRLVDRVEKTKDVLNDRERQLWKAVMPIFRAARGITSATTLYSVNVTDTDVVAHFGHPNDSPTEMSLPIKIFEQDDPKAAAKKFEDKRQAGAEKKSRQQRRAAILNELQELEDDD